MAFEDSFPTVNITFRSGRKQGDWEDDMPTEGVFNPITTPVSITLESVIQYFKDKPVSGAESKINKAVVTYLEEYRQLKIENRHDSQNGVVSDVESEIQAEIDAGL